MVALAGVAIGGELTIAEELIGFHKPAGWDLEARRSLPEKFQEACRKALGGNLWAVCRESLVTRCSEKM